MPAKKNTPHQPASKTSAPQADERIVVENVNVPGSKVQLDAGMYQGMRQALLKVVPPKAPGLTQSEMREAVVPHLPQELFPGGAKAVQLDLEAKGLLVREPTKPLRWHRAAKR
jgi:hypothetical protein